MAVQRALSDFASCIFPFIVVLDRNAWLLTEGIDGIVLPPSTLHIDADDHADDGQDDQQGPQAVLKPLNHSGH